MGNLLATIIIAAIFIGIALSLLAVGWLITGKQKIKRGMCGKDPKKSRDDNCNNNPSCSICEPPKKKDEK
jgi:hypothetical protein